MADTDYDDDLPADQGAGLANAMIIVTTLILIGAIWMMSSIAATQYGVGPMA